MKLIPESLYLTDPNFEKTYKKQNQFVITGFPSNDEVKY